jgi:hypothetical protein
MQCVHICLILNYFCKISYFSVLFLSTLKVRTNSKNMMHRLFVRIRTNSPQTICPGPDKYKLHTVQPISSDLSLMIYNSRRSTNWGHCFVMSLQALVMDMSCSMWCNKIAYWTILFIITIWLFVWTRTNNKF